MPFDNSVLFEVALLLGEIIKSRKLKSAVQEASSSLLVEIGIVLQALVNKRMQAHDDWNPELHPRGQPKNKGEFAKSPSAGSTGGKPEVKEGGIVNTLHKAAQTGGAYIPATGLPHYLEEVGKSASKESPKTKLGSIEHLTALFDKKGFKPVSDLTNSHRAAFSNKDFTIFIAMPSDIWQMNRGDSIKGYTPLADGNGRQSLLKYISELPDAGTPHLEGEALHEYNQQRLHEIEERNANESKNALYSKLSPLLEATGLKPQTLEDLPSALVHHGDLREAEDVTDDNIMALKAFRGAVDSITGSKLLDKFREHLYKTAKVVACNFKPENAIMATTKDSEGNPIFMVNMQVNIKDFITDPVDSKFNHSMQKGYAVYKKTGNLQDALAATYKGTVQHELGHAFDAWCNGDLSEMVYETVQNNKLGTTYEESAHYIHAHVSEYAAKSQQECAAEIFNMVMDGSKIPSELGAIAKYIRGA
jgi:hypothetical protein